MLFLSFARERQTPLQDQSGLTRSYLAGLVPCLLYSPILFDSQEVNANSFANAISLQTLLSPVTTTVVPRVVELGQWNGDLPSQLPGCRCSSW